MGFSASFVPLIYQRDFFIMFRCTKKWTPFILFSLVCCLSFFFYSPSKVSAANVGEVFSATYRTMPYSYTVLSADGDVFCFYSSKGFSDTENALVIASYKPFRFHLSSRSDDLDMNPTFAEINNVGFYYYSASTSNLWTNLSSNIVDLSPRRITSQLAILTILNELSVPPVPDDTVDLTSVGYLQNVQNYSSVYSVTSSGNANALLERYIKFGWDSETSTGVRLTQNDSISFDFVCDIYTNPTFGQGDLLASNYKVHYGDFAAYGLNGYAQTLPFCGLNIDNDNNYFTFYNAVYADFGRSDIRIYNPRFYLTPYVRQQAGNFLIGGTTRLVFDENLNTFFTGITPNTSSNGTLNSDGSFSTSENQIGTGTGNGIASSGDSFSEALQNQNSVIQGVINGNISLDLDNLTTNLGGLLDDVKGIPSLFSSLFSWLPPWCLVLVAACIASIFLIGLIKVVIS